MFICLYIYIIGVSIFLAWRLAVLCQVDKPLPSTPRLEEACEILCEKSFWAVGNCENLLKDYREYPV